MKYKDIRENLEEMMNDNYKDFIKALVSIEKGVNDEKELEEVYVLYMNNDTTGLLNDDFDYMITNDLMARSARLLERTRCPSFKMVLKVSSYLRLYSIALPGFEPAKTD
ncbi:Uncharacterised protein [Streptococcus pneumoniae]|nr:Uncharacterised protein [Streptococcus pneumoniae]